MPRSGSFILGIKSKSQGLKPSATEVRYRCVHILIPREIFGSEEGFNRN